MAWNPLQKKPSLCVKPSLSQGLSTHMEDRELEMCFNNLQNLEDNMSFEIDQRNYTGTLQHKFEKYPSFSLDLFC